MGEPSNKRKNNEDDTELAVECSAEYDKHQKTICISICVTVWIYEHNWTIEMSAETRMIKNKEIINYKMKK